VDEDGGWRRKVRKMTFIGIKFHPTMRINTLGET
jgi:hypothetical protein